MEKKPAPFARLEYLDSLRGIAATSVLWSHYFLAYPLPQSLQHIASAFPIHLLWDGSAAVSFFFVLSGFVLSLKFFRQSETRYGSYLITRLGRIWLPYVFIVAVSLILKMTLLEDLTTTPAQSAWIQGFWRNITQPKHFLLELNLFTRPTLFTLVPHGWSLFTEMTISILIPAAVLLTKKRRWALVLVSAASIWIGLPVYLFHFSVGLLLAQYYVSGTGLLQTRVGVARAFPVLLLGLVLYGARYGIAMLFSHTFNEDTLSVISGIGSLVILAAVLISTGFQNVLNTPFLRHLGKISYSIYLCHFALLLCFTPRVIHLLNALGLTHELSAWGVGLALTTALTWTISGGLHRWIEMPSLALANRISKKYFYPSSYLS